MTKQTYHDWRDVRRGAIADRQITEAGVADERRRLDSILRASRLADIRKHQSVTQKELAETLSVSQARISQIERGELGRAELDTLRAYVAALGGSLQLVADFGDQALVLDDLVAVSHEDVSA